MTAGTAVSRERATASDPGTVITGRETVLRALDAWGTVITLEVAPGDCVDANSLLDVHTVLEECRAARSMTGDLFDPWSLDDGFDPSGYVKGWGAGRLANLLMTDLAGLGACGVCVNAGGDVSVRGTQADGTPWPIGIRDPDDAGAILRVITSTEGHVATSGLYERGAHVVDPRDGSRPEAGDGRLTARLATVWGPDDGLADAFATALLLGGREAAGAFEELRASDEETDRPSRWGAYVVEDGRAWRLGETDSLAAPRLDVVG